ncbi:hypothetical protein GLAREA_12184 [Glarea lozoyensis ATCC 20868]|uniref:Uncharacterized protein n=1 Tax=Glarea lozoyensis (strain ATCC 20868 / MF5171) TaxID=1116229 RepID=S3D0P5_GLAL2|nr:uncharacterized protein GLAREA_12184 [Glarea lozoyensis ATCC 20868]EPE32102.1 hypothetical protein GLAREA_12184 [Glarea lozoyensis ATCC 20868]
MNLHSDSRRNDGHPFNDQSRIFIDLTVDDQCSTNSKASSTISDQISSGSALALKQQSMEVSRVTNQETVVPLQPLGPTDFYTVLKRSFIKEEMITSIVEDIFLDRDEANYCARALAESEAQRRCTSSTNFTDQEHLYKAKITFNEKAPYDVITVFIELGKVKTKNKSMDDSSPQTLDGITLSLELSASGSKKCSELCSPSTTSSSHHPIIEGQLLPAADVSERVRDENLDSSALSGDFGNDAEPQTQHGLPTGASDKT